MRNAALTLGVIGGIIGMIVGFFSYGYVEFINWFGPVTTDFLRYLLLSQEQPFDQEDLAAPTRRKLAGGPRQGETACPLAP